MHSRTVGFLLILVLLAGCGSANNFTPTTIAESGKPAAGLTPRPTIAASTALPATAMSHPLTALPTTPATVIPTSAPTTVPVSPEAATAVPVSVTASSVVKDSITIVEPAAGATIQSPLRITGNATFLPFEANFGVAVYDSEGNILGQTGITGQGEYGSPSTFAGTIEFAAPATIRPGKVVVYVASARDGSIEVQREVRVQLSSYAGSDPYIALPAENANVTLPLHIEAVNGETNAPSLVRLQYDDGTLLEDAAFTPGGEKGTVVTNLMWATESAPPNPPTQYATLELVDGNGQVVAARRVYVLNYNDPAVMPIRLFFQLGDELRAVTRYIPRTQAVATAALRELSWGPAGNELAAAGFTTLLPTPEKIVGYPGRQVDWSNRVFLQSISIKDGIATIDWSKEMAAWGGGSAYLDQLNQQITRTLQQFSSIQSVQMTVNGSQEILQP